MDDDLETLAGVVKASLRVLDLKPQDAGTAALAVTYAERIDDGDGDLRTLGPALLAALDALLATPKARAAAMKGAPDAPERPDELDELLARRQRKATG